jgi:hypothetical protein
MQGECFPFRGHTPPSCHVLDTKGSEAHNRTCLCCGAEKMMNKNSECVSAVERGAGQAALGKPHSWPLPFFPTLIPSCITALVPPASGHNVPGVGT